MINPSKILYVSMEGGGGKGAVYLGALAALAELGVLEETSKGSREYSILRPPPNKPRLVGISGASAGAITAALLASGHTTKDLFNFMTSGVIASFYDSASRQIPDVMPDPSNKEGCKTNNSRNNNITKILLALTSDPPILAIMLMLLIPILQQCKALNKIPSALADALLGFPPGLALPGYIASLIQDFGLFSGCRARKLIDDMISAKIEERQIMKGLPVTKEKNVTFGRFFEIFEVDLVVTGTNISNGSSMYFSAANTNDFRVADAVRISMSFPGVFKPVIVPGKAFQGVSPGVWIDGGLLNNNPMHAFDDPQTGAVQKNLLGLRIGEDKIKAVDDIFDFTSAIFSTMVSSSESMQIRTQEERDRTIQLAERGLTLLEFSPPVSLLNQVVREAASTVLEKFNKKTRLIVNDILRQWKMFPLPVRISPRRKAPITI